MFEFLIPDRCFLTFDRLTPAFLKKRGIKGLILDIDNTIVPYEEKEPGTVALDWFKRMEEAGIRIAFVSNNNSQRVSEFNAVLGYPHYPDSKKPFGKNIRRAMRAMGTNRKNTALMGDQIFTDVLAARMAGLCRTFLVPPIKDRTDFLTQTKRRFERPIIAVYAKTRKLKLKRLRLKKLKLCLPKRKEKKNES